MSGYKKYMKQDVRLNNSNNSLLKIFIMSFFGMLLVFSFLIKSFSPSVDTSIGDYKADNLQDEYELSAKNVDDRLSAIQDEDRGRDFSAIMDNVDKKENINNLEESNDVVDNVDKSNAEKKNNQQIVNQSINSQQNVESIVRDPLYKVFIGSYSSVEQAKIAKDLIIESGGELNPIVKCIGSNNYTLQVGIFKNKNSAEALLSVVKQYNLPGRIVQEN